MTTLALDCVEAHPDTNGLSPNVVLRLAVREVDGAPIYALALRIQIRIEPAQRRYSDAEAADLGDLFGEKSRWANTVKPMQLAFLSTVVPGFRHSTDIDLLLPASYDFEVAAHKYLHSLADGDIPLLLLFSGSVFLQAADGRINVEPIAWQTECRFALPVAVWRAALDVHFPGTAWLRLPHETFDALYRYRVEHQLLDFDDAVQRLLKVGEVGTGEGRP